MFSQRLARIRVGAAAGAVAVLMVVGLAAGTAYAQMTQAANPQGAARVWFYRDYEPYVSRNYATVMLNGAVAGSVQPYGGATYRDVAPGQYHATVQSVGSDVNQAVDLNLASGQEAYLKIQSSPAWMSNGDTTSFERDTYYLRLMPTNLARAQIGNPNSAGSSATP